MTEVRTSDRLPGRAGLLPAEMLEVDVRARGIANFAQLILLLVNIIQGISLALLAQQLVAIDIWNNTDYALYARLIACLIMIWFVTFQYAVAVVTLWLVANGIRDILFIMIFGLTEYGAIYSVADARRWLIWVVLMIAAGVPCFLSTTAHISTIIKGSPNPIFIATRKHAVLNLLHIVLAGLFLLCIAIATYLSSAVASIYAGYYGDYIVPAFVVVYCLHVLRQDSRFLNGLFYPSLGAPESQPRLRLSKLTSWFRIFLLLVSYYAGVFSVAWAYGFYLVRTAAQPTAICLFLLLDTCQGEGLGPASLPPFRPYLSWLSLFCILLLAIDYSVGRNRKRLPDVSS